MEMTVTGAAALLVISLAMILLAAEAFTNGIELVGRRLSFSQAVVGSILAAIGTALPETILPMVAIFSHNASASHEIGVGAILGAPFMLATVGFFLIGITALLGARAGRRTVDVKVESLTLKRDLSFFLVMYAAAIVLPAVFGHGATGPLAVFLLTGYGYYVFQTVAADSAGMEHFEGLHIVKLPVRFGWLEDREHHVAWAFFQVGAALLLMVWGAKIFVANLQVVSAACGLSPLLFALLVAPVATELPEKFNSVTWILKGKDTLAVGNMTGAMVFQATFPVSIGLLFTPWKVEGLALVSALLALLSAAIVLGAVHFRGKLVPGVMLWGGGFYAAYALAVIFLR